MGDDADQFLTEPVPGIRTVVRDGAVVQYLGIQTDVTARVEAERALATEQDRNRDDRARIPEVATRLAGAQAPAGWPVQSSTDSPRVRRA
jgi:hypothetical protein